MAALHPGLVPPRTKAFSPDENCHPLGRAAHLDVVHVLDRDEFSLATDKSTEQKAFFRLFGFLDFACWMMVSAGALSAKVAPVGMARAMPPLPSRSFSSDSLYPALTCQLTVFSHHLLIAS